MVMATAALEAGRALSALRLIRRSLGQRGRGHRLPAGHRCVEGELTECEHDEVRAGL